MTDTSFWMLLFPRLLNKGSFENLEETSDLSDAFRTKNDPKYRRCINVNIFNNLYISEFPKMYALRNP
jgi:hypothetical protein